MQETDIPRCAVRHDYIKANGINVFYREAGTGDRPTLLLLHGFPTSSHMFRDLIPLVAEHFHVVAPDYPGFGHSDMPDRDDFVYSFDNLAAVTDSFLKELGVSRFVVYIQDYGGPVGMRLFERDPDRVDGIIVQNANLYTEGLGSLFRDKIGPLWEDPSDEEVRAVYDLFEYEGTRFQYVTGAGDPRAIHPDALWHAQFGLNRPGNKDIQYDLQADYHSNIEAYPRWLSLLKRHQPRFLVMWGKGDPLFSTENVRLLEQDMEDMEAHILDAGHFAVEEQPEFIAEQIVKRFS